MNTDVCKALGDAIAKQRNDTGITQEDLAARVDLSSRSIQRIEAGTEQPRYETLFKIARALNTTPDQFIRPMWERWFEMH
ncbi:helix-turn-helix domain-containing protein [Nitrosomonas marina]|uniref:Helix-turn-helix n=1 Tax=Nitrosomonas marina TaxID=917 RepID=A0A1H8HUJ9_9PROT|nr:helix-turn-helix transcriptional regulator [Nitrosomonas marina]SEN59757.1 Helix-turn-helix [Nitrosomonas marina]